MPDNDDDLSRRLAVVEQTFGLRPVNNNQVVNPTNEPIQATHVDNINWKALYKVLESEVETIVLDPNCPQYVKDWGNRIMERLAQFIPRR
jgi:hypothetical protein